MRLDEHLDSPPFLLKSSSSQSPLDSLPCLLKPSSSQSPPLDYHLVSHTLSLPPSDRNWRRRWINRGCGEPWRTYCTPSPPPTSSPPCPHSPPSPTTWRRLTRSCSSPPSWFGWVGGVIFCAPAGSWASLNEFSGFHHLRVMYHLLSRCLLLRFSLLFFLSPFANNYHPYNLIFYLFYL